MLASGSMDKSTKILKFKNFNNQIEGNNNGSNKPLMELDCELELGQHHGMVRSVKFDRYGRKLLTSGQDENLKIWDVETGKLMTHLGDQGCFKSNSKHVRYYLTLILTYIFFIDVVDKSRPTVQG